MFYHDPTTLAAELLDRCIAKKLTIVTAESCTGGLVAALLTSIDGASVVFDRGFITYSNSAKHEMLGVSEALLEKYGAVSREVACAMVQGALDHTKADLAVAVTGIAGPGGGSVVKPVGLVHIVAQKRDHKPLHHERRFGNRGRDQVRHASVIEAIAMLRQVAG
jgi:nicotinamide-nucleotide amidase